MVLTVVFFFFFLGHVTVGISECRGRSIFEFLG
jgi:hypothetical protein